jgi:hypothetical protein
MMGLKDCAAGLEETGGGPAGGEAKSFPLVFKE